MEGFTYRGKILLEGGEVEGLTFGAGSTALEMHADAFSNTVFAVVLNAAVLAKGGSPAFGAEPPSLLVDADAVAWTNDACSLTPSMLTDGSALTLYTAISQFSMLTEATSLTLFTPGAVFAVDALLSLLTFLAQGPGIAVFTDDKKSAQSAS